MRSRRAVAVRLQEVALERARAAKDERRARLRREHERLVTQHEQWLANRDDYCVEAADTARRTLEVHLSSPEGIRELSKRARAVRSSSRSKKGPTSLKALSRSEALEFARSAWFEEVGDKARSVALVEYEESVVAPLRCQRCRKTFATPHEWKSHVSLCGVGDVRETLLLNQVREQASLIKATTLKLAPRVHRSAAAFCHRPRV